MKILFVCTGNTCRSPMAEALAKKILGAEFEISSAGIAAWDGDQVSFNAYQVMKEEGLDLSAHKARRITEDIVSQADLVVTMTNDHQSRLQSLFPEHKDKIKALASWSDSQELVDIPDPWGGPVEVYRESAKTIKALIERLKVQLDKMQ